MGRLLKSVVCLVKGDCRFSGEVTVHVQIEGWEGEGSSRCGFKKSGNGSSKEVEREEATGPRPAGAVRLPGWAW